jgi:hypothetical protein
VVRCLLTTSLPPRLTAANSDSVANIDVNHGSFMTAALARQAVWGLRGKDVKPKSNGLFFSLIHSLSTYDLVNDASAGGTLDLQKYGDTTAQRNQALVGIQGQRIGNIGGTEWYESNAVPTETNWQSTSKLPTTTTPLVMGNVRFFAWSYQPWAEEL